MSDLRTLGPESGDGMVVRGSLSSLGWVGGADAVVDALCEVYVLASDLDFLLRSDPECWWCLDARQMLESERG